MTIQEAVDKGFMKLSDDEIEQVLNDLYDNDDAQDRFEGGIALMQTIVPEERIGAIIDLSNIIIEANDELEEGDEEDEEDHEGHDHN